MGILQYMILIIYRNIESTGIFCDYKTVHKDYFFGTPYFRMEFRYYAIAFEQEIANNIR